MERNKKTAAENNARSSKSKAKKNRNVSGLTREPSNNGNYLSPEKTKEFKEYMCDGKHFF
jgi:hypothetical protein